MSEAAASIGSIADCVAYFESGETPREDYAIGTEHEKIGVLADSGDRVRYEGERGVGVLLERIAERDGWKRVYEDGHVIALGKEGASITLEPGGQIELSGAPLKTIRETCREFNAHVDLVKEVSEDLDIVWLALAVDPLHDASQVPVMPKHRYEIMRSYLPQKGGLALDMMYASATVQANFDFSNERDMSLKMRTAMGITPIVSAIFANSSIAAGTESGFVSKRVAIWRDTDPDRCGILHQVFEPGFGYRDYAEWALDVPMFFIIRDDRYIPAHGTSFRTFMEDGFEGHHAIVGDWDMHLTTLFPEVRLKRIIEVRGADAVPRDLICALPALWKGILYDDDALDAAWQLVSGYSHAEREAAQLAVAREGLGASIAQLPVLELAREIVEISAKGLARIAAVTGIHPDEQIFLDPIRALIERGQSPGEVILDKWRGDWQGSMDRLIEYARY
jgi:glutamate--cysteine ligase